ncbi:MAG: hypothetical protein V7647_2196, partial [Acidobacteriota bacterium]
VMELVDQHQAQREQPATSPLAPAPKAP